MRRFSTALLGAVLCVLVATASEAQTTGSINGAVADNTGGMLPGVTVTATSPAMMGAQTAVSDVEQIAGSREARIQQCGIESPRLLGRLPRLFQRLGRGCGVRRIRVFAEIRSSKASVRTGEGRVQCHRPLELADGELPTRG